MPSRRTVEENRRRLSRPESLEIFPRSYVVEDREAEKTRRFSTRTRDAFSEDERGHDQTKEGELKRDRRR